MDQEDFIDCEEPAAQIDRQECLAGLPPDQIFKSRWWVNQDVSLSCLSASR